MANTTSTLLTLDERQSLYNPPLFTKEELGKYFSFSDQETKALYNFADLSYAVYFAISLTFFKLKKTLVSFKYSEVTLMRQYIMERYFPNKPSFHRFPHNKDVIARIENKVLALTGFLRFNRENTHDILTQIQQEAMSYPRQRQLCKALLQHLVKSKIAIPSFTTLQTRITHIWQKEQTRVTTALYRYTTQEERGQILSLLEKTDEHHHIISIKKDMKAFNTKSIVEELNKFQMLKAIFLIAESTLPQLQLPEATIHYYSDLIHYYNSTRLKRFEDRKVLLYLLCYSHSRFKMLNDNLLEAFKKRTANYITDVEENAKKISAEFVDDLDAARHKIYNLLMTIKNDRHKTHIKKSVLFKCIPGSELEIIANLMINEKLDKKALFWQAIDSQSHSIILNLRPLFLDLDMKIIQKESLNAVVLFMKKYFNQNKKTPIDLSMTDWIPPDELPYIVKDNHIIFNRFEFLLYKLLAHHIDTNKLVLSFPIKHKLVEDNLMPPLKWEKEKKEKKELIRSTPYPKLQLKSPIPLLDDKEKSLKDLYQKVNYDIENGNPNGIIIKKNKKGEQIWRLPPLEKTKDPNDSLFLHFPKRSIVDIMRFVNHKTHYSDVIGSILPHSIKTNKNTDLINAVILSNVIRLGPNGMATVCDFTLRQLLTTDNEYIRMETMCEATQRVNTATEAFEIFKQYSIRGLNHASLDALKVATRKLHIKARHSPKFLGMETGVSSYNLIFNHLPITGMLISSNDYEGKFLFELLHHQNKLPFKIDLASTDRHGLNCFNPGLLDLTEIPHAPRIPKPHNEILWGLGKLTDYNYSIINPDKIANRHYIINQWDPIQRFVFSMLNGTAIPSVVIGKMSSNKYHSKTKLALTHYDHLVRSEFILQTLDNPLFRIAIECALNRGEAFNNLYRAISLLNGGKFRGQTEIEMMVWDQCTRLVASIILYYNTYILNHLFINAKSQEEKDFILGLSPGAWIHIILLGYYRFSATDSSGFIDDWLKKWDWQHALKLG